LQPTHGAAKLIVEAFPIAMKAIEGLAVGFLPRFARRAEANRQRGGSRLTPSGMNPVLLELAIV